MTRNMSRFSASGLKKLAKKILPNQDIANLPSAAQTVQLWNTLHPNEKNQVASLAANANHPPILLVTPPVMIKPIPTAAPGYTNSLTPVAHL